MRELSLFTGVGGGLLGTVHLLGWRPVGYVEIEDYCQRVLKQRIADGLLPDAPIFGDIRTFLSEGYAASYSGMVDVVTGGFPCQDISIAGKGKGIEGSRSGLWKKMSKIIGIIRPSYAFVENSPALTSRGLGVVLGDLVEMGYDCRWGVFSAGAIGFDHERARIFIYAHNNKDANTRDRITGRKWLHSYKSKRIYRKNCEDWKSRVRDLVSMDVCTWSDSYSEGRRILYGMDHGMDRLAAIGNGQVPQVVATAWRVLSGQ